MSTTDEVNQKIRYLASIDRNDSMFQTKFKPPAIQPEQRFVTRLTDDGYHIKCVERVEGNNG